MVILGFRGSMNDMKINLVDQKIMEGCYKRIVSSLEKLQ